ncbi:type II glyceraldehyde-3-phosphate dehydrogenase [Methanoculleus bourgensis]|jgi:glyceraldehyde-3-phosphate dehydrogenase (NAD(P))|uniref:Glyceraldehyde-3-phosphate dehydrogenase n=1 Tax=Methanoculleus bourgensis TaxID=83986 RepID=A0A0X8XZ88_9EURY|nr:MULTISPECIES: type II glyceraldehyde-3-phosphate dehydrogenase [Methanoculleus]MBT0732616.1 type II glyceraldehyde-3-phosphate dehydrogenase [Methanoculleus bourgensis]MDD3373071.1 type II glyceraldehyde-3-phosphate dehydrogenase [Methanoculleus bourgensis]NMA87845.1 type II glyceraldehyde-3-phosphate dehydrogenase [Methanoculleus bourgensis]CVK34718.1 Glyceraldehyde-3-phosphate dehydrogenase [Methanoculleus bourgensis]GLI45271.1 glyceraldehyde-3-phosphate dehydrogenase [Methanoculleus bour
MIKVAINGYGTIGKRVADAVAAQPDMEVIGVSKTSVSSEAYIAKERGYPLYIADLSKKSAFEKAGIEVAGDVDAMLKAADIVVDATPGGVGEKNRPIYERLGKKAIFQGGEGHEVAGFSFNAHANYKEAAGKQFARVVSCNTTGLVRLIHALDQAFGVERVRAVMVRRGADPDDIKRGPIDAIVLNPATIPSHHGPDVQTVLPHINIVTLAMIVPTTFMHMHSIQADLKRETTRDEVLAVFENHSRIGLVRKATGIKSNAQLREYTQDLGRPRTDLWENGVFEESVSVLDGKEFYCFQAIHQEADVIPENIDCIRALMGTVKDPEESIRMTNEALGLVAIG